MNLRVSLEVNSKSFESSNGLVVWTEVVPHFCLYVGWQVCSSYWHQTQMGTGRVLVAIESNIMKLVHLWVTFITRLILALSLLINCYTFNIIEFRATKNYGWSNSTALQHQGGWCHQRQGKMNIKIWRCCCWWLLIWILDLVFPAFSRTSRHGFHGHGFCRDMPG